MIDFFNRIRYNINIKTYRYDAFGVEKNLDESDTNAFIYCGEYYDSETGIIELLIMECKFIK